jgi:Leucine-rich repeat (LRR) protein
VDLQPLTYCKQLSKLEFIDCFKLRDLKPLASLNNLKLLRLVGSDVVDVSPLSELKSLEIRYRE